MANKISFLVAQSLLVIIFLLFNTQSKSLDFYSPTHQDREQNLAQILESNQVLFVGALSLNFTSTANFGNRGTCSGSIDVPINIALLSDGTGKITIKGWNFWYYFNMEGNCIDQGFVRKSGDYTRDVTHANGQFRWETAVYNSQNEPYPGSEVVISGPFDNNNLTASGQSRYIVTDIVCCDPTASASNVLNYQIKAINQQTLPTDPDEHIILNVEEPAPSSQYTGVANVRGWAVAPTGISRIQQFVDGVYSTDIPSGGRRVDVGNAYPAYPSSIQSGFSMAFNYSALESGMHEIKIRATDNVGASKEVPISFEVIRFQNSFITDPGMVSFSNATCTVDGNSVHLTNLTAEGIGYDTILQWWTATQGLEFIRIVSHAGK